MKNYLLIDGSNLLHRSYYVASRKPLINSKGDDTGTIFRFIVSLKTLAAEFKVPAKNIYVAWDKRKKWPEVGFRAKALANTESEYKGNRDTEKSKLVYSNGETVEEMIKSLGAHNFYPSKLEADDCISWLAKNLDGKKVIVSVDKDLMQLIDDNTSFYNPIKTVVITPKNFEEHAEVPQECFVKYKAILGDKSDNVPGLEGFGKIKAARLAKNFNAAELTQEQALLVERNISLMDLTTGYKVEQGEEEDYIEQAKECAKDVADFGRFESICSEKEFKSILGHMSEWRNVFCKPDVDLNEYMVQLFGSQ